MITDNEDDYHNYDQIITENPTVTNSKPENESSEVLENDQDLAKIHEHMTNFDDEMFVNLATDAMKCQTLKINNLNLTAPASPWRPTRSYPPKRSVSPSWSSSRGGTSTPTGTPPRPSCCGRST